MTPRLSVLMVQPPRLSALQSKIQDQLVVELIGVPGIDLAIVGSLDPAEGTATDQLLISSLAADLAVIDWRGADDVLDLLIKCGLSVARAPHPLDLKAGPVSGQGMKRIYVFDLRNGDKPLDIVGALKGLLRDRRVVAIPIGMAVQAKVTSERSAGDDGKGGLSSAYSPLGSVGSSLGGESSQPERIVGSPRSRREDSELDALVDGVNEADW